MPTMPAIPGFTHIAQIKAYDKLDAFDRLQADEMLGELAKDSSFLSVRNKLYVSEDIEEYYDEQGYEKACLAIDKDTTVYGYITTAEHYSDVDDPSFQAFEYQDVE